MKRPFIFIVTALMAASSVCALAGCGTEKTSSASGAAATTAAATAADTSGAASASSVSAEDTLFSYNGVTVELDGDAQAAIDALGEPISTSSQATCHGTEGDDKTFVYDGFSINTYPRDGQDRVLEIVVNSADVPTTKGVKVGDGIDAVKAAYGDGYREVGAYYAYETEDGKSIQFMINNDAVTEIDYYYDVK